MPANFIVTLHLADVNIYFLLLELYDELSDIPDEGMNVHY